MSRFIQDVPIQNSENSIQFICEDFLKKEGFEFVAYKGQMVWKKGVGLLMAPQFISLQYGPGILHIEAWIKFAILPGVYCGEMGINGFLAAIPKSQLRNRINTLMSLISRLEPVSQGIPIANTAAYQTSTAIPQGNFGEDNLSEGFGQPPMPTPNFVNGQPQYIAIQQDSAGKATAGLVLGIVSMITWPTIFIGIITSIIGIVLSNAGKNSSRSGQGIAGLILSIVGLVLSGIILIVYWLAIWSAV